jgi:hypothetical protein
VKLQGCCVGKEVGENSCVGKEWERQKYWWWKDPNQAEGEEESMPIVLHSSSWLGSSHHQYFCLPPTCVEVGTVSSQHVAGATAVKGLISTDLNVINGGGTYPERREVDLTISQHPECPEERWSPGTGVVEIRIGIESKGYPRPRRFVVALDCECQFQVI